ncbi:MAG: glycosyltransferase family 39 protein [Solirubrobacterales bacterium]|nr:glycosyltransferase family 39 protein [Solirubrobacterales bacterium]
MPGAGLVTAARRHRVVLVALLAITLALRLWGIKQGLPYSYNSDEATHFVPRAIAYFGHDYNPQYFLNPPAYSYLLHIVFELWFGSADATRRLFVSDPTTVFVVARVVAAVLGTMAVWLTYLAGRRLFGRTAGLVAAAIFGLAFLPIFYSHLALNDVPTLAPVALALYGVAGIVRNGSWRDYAIAGVGIGLGAATKYTGGITIVCLLGAFAGDAVSGTPLQSVRRVLGAVACALLAFVAANPYSVLDYSAFHAGVTLQQSLAGGADPIKLGTTTTSGTAYYLWTLTWGLGWVPAIAAAGGAGLLLVRRWLALAAVLLPAPIAFIIFMGDQQRFFARWLLPVFEIVSLLAGYAIVEVVHWLIVRRRVPVGIAVAAAAVIVLGQSVAAAVHSDVILSRADTRNLTRAWMVDHVPAGAKIVVEPVVSEDWAQDIGRANPATSTGARWRTWNTAVTNVDADGRPLPAGEHRLVPVDQYERTLRPELLDEYARADVCWVVVGSLQAGRSFAQPGIAPAAIGYYAQLADHARLEYSVTPFAARSRAVPFNFDWSIDYYPGHYARPGPEMSVYRLTSGRCASR